MEINTGEVVTRVARKILDWSNENMSRVWWGEGIRTGSYVPVLNHNDRDHQLFAVYTKGRIVLYFQYYKEKIPFTDDNKRRELRRKLNAIDGVDIPEDGIDRRSSIDLSLLAEGSKIDEFLSIYDWVVSEVVNS